MSKLFVSVERVEDLMGRADNYFDCDLCGKDSVDATAFACAAKRKPITNADRIRSMTDEELAEIFVDNFCGYCHIHDFCFAKGCAINCEDVWLDWLKQEAET